MGAVGNDETDSSFNRKKLCLMDHNPIVRFKVCNGALYDVRFIKSGNLHLLVTCGEGGVFVFKWSKILERLIKAVQPEQSSRLSNPVMEKLTPVSKFQAKPFLYAGPIEMNGISYDETLGHLYCAAGDLFGGYVWDIESNKCIGTLGNGKYLNFQESISCHTNYLHSIKAVPHGGVNLSAHCILTGGEDGKIGIWDGKALKLIEMIDCKTAMKTPLIERTSLWVSSIDVEQTGNWAVIGGGIDHLSLSSRSNNKDELGFMASLNLPTRTISTSSPTREIINNVAYHSKNGKIVSVGNESVVSYWDQCDFSGGRQGRSWLTSSSAYSISVHPEGRLMAVAGVGRSVDCLSDMATRFTLAL